eukprot:1965671-Lingulodinium_polyedra.AAC.1
MQLHVSNATTVINATNIINATNAMTCNQNNYVQSMRLHPIYPINAMDATKCLVQLTLACT